MITFKSVKWRNLLSTGNQFTELQLNRSISTLIIGVNGGGKSTLIDAITFALYGKPFRNITKGQLVNSINRKELEVVLEFSIGTKEYKVVRGMKPNIFEIYIDGDLINQDAASKDYQQYLEKNILKLNYKSFTQNSILASAKYVPFMQLPAGTRREVVEDLLDISVFSDMNEILKEKMGNVKTKITEVQHNIDIELVRLESQEKYIKTVESDLESRKRTIQSNIENFNIQIKEKTVHKKDVQEKLDTIQKPDLKPIEDSILSKQEKIVKLKDVIDALKDQKKKVSDEVTKSIDDVTTKDIQQKIDNNENVIVEETKKLSIMEEELKNLHMDNTPFDENKLFSFKEKAESLKINITLYKDEVSKKKAGIEHATGEIKFFESNNVCPTCSQGIEDDFKKSFIKDMNNVIEEYNNFISHKEAIIKETLEQLEEAESEEEDYKRSVQKKQMEDYNVLKSQCFELREKIDNLKSEKDSFIKELRNYIDSSKKESTDKLIKLDESLTDANQRLSRFELDIQTLESDKRKEISNYENLTEELNREIYKITSTIETIESQIENLQKEYKGLDSNVNIKEEIIKKENIESLILEMQQDYNNQSNYKRHLEYALGMMKDNGIKTSIINKYIPIINKLINSYLQTMDLFVQYELDETFNESIKSRYRDEFSYDSFSEGEKARIDLAILFTFRAISKMKSTSATNLLLLDETFDGSIDADGSDSISAILRTLTDTHVFCISHNEKMFDKFHSLIKFEKIQNYSVMC